MPKKRQSLKNRGLVPTIQPEPDFSWTCGFRQMLDNVELIMYIKFQKLLMTGCRDMDKKHQKYPQNGGFPPFVTPQDFFSKIGLCHFCTFMVDLTSCKKLEKTDGRSLSYLKTDRPTNGQMDQRTNRADYIRRIQINQGPKNQRNIVKSYLGK